MISPTSLYKYHGIMLVAYGSMWDLFIFRTTVKPEFSVLFHAAHDLKSQTHNLETEEKQVLFH